MWWSVSIALLAGPIWTAFCYQAPALELLTDHSNSSAIFVNDTEGLTNGEALEKIQKGVEVFTKATSGLAAAFPPLAVFNGLAEALFLIPTFGETKDITKEVGNLQKAMSSLHQFVSDGQKRIVLLMERLHFDVHFVGPLDVLSYASKNFIMKDLRHPDTQRFLRVCDEQPPIVIIERMFRFFTSVNYANDFLEDTHFSLWKYEIFSSSAKSIEAALMTHAVLCFEYASYHRTLDSYDAAQISNAYSLIKSVNDVLDKRASHREATWWKDGIISGAKAFLQTLRKNDREGYAANLKRHLDLNYGRSNSTKFVKVFGVVIFDEKLTYLPVAIEADNRVALFKWEAKSSYVLIYKSSFAEDNSTFVSNVNFHNANFKNVTGIFEDMKESLCPRKWPYRSVDVVETMKLEYHKAQELNSNLFYFVLVQMETKNLWIDDDDYGDNFQDANIFPPSDVFKNLARAIYEYPSTIQTNEVREEHVKLRTAIWKLSEAINASYEAVEPFVEKRYLDSHVVEHANHYRVALFKHIMPAPSTRTRRQDDLLSMMKNYPPVFDEPISFRIYKSMFLHGAGGAFETAKVALFLTGYHDNEEFLKRAHYSLSAYTNFQVMIRRLYFEALLMMNIRCVFGTEDGVVKHWGKDEIWRSHQRIPSLEAVLADGVKLQAAGWWKSGLLSGAKKFLSADEFNNTSKDYSALRLKAFLDENYGHSHWPMKEVHRFGVLIFNDSFAYTPGIEEDPRAVFFRWEGKSAYVLIYKSTFGEEGNETYIHNKKFYWNNTNQIEDTFSNVRYLRIVPATLELHSTRIGCLQTRGRGN
ncbi:hypothetical protein QR680_004258 [Steinernema hermaphroditum]|uniref:Uncharacterized protein n=1 Tax=Steinernema hermaphroditum TaxID=289476 RepID=A0AA39HN47_9BILA|nr:hypothetical protein QR680_004258 [Steinernema hermaphroditum]